MFKGRTFVMLALALVTLLTVSAAGAAGPAIARPDPLVSSVAVGQTFTVNLYLQDIVAAYGADVRMCFDAAVIEAQDADAFAPGIQIQPLGSFMSPGFVIKKEASNAPDPNRDECKNSGFVWYAFTQLNPAQPVSGSGPIAAVTFKALKPGVSPLTISYQKAADRNGAEIPTVKQDGSVQVGGASEKKRVMLPVILR
jgi:hypothetical protein